MPEESLQDAGGRHGYVISAGHADVDFIRQMAGDAAPQQLIAADAGICICHVLGLTPAHIVGDFDSLTEQTAYILDAYRADPSVTIHPYVPEKDWTDTELAVDLGIRLGWKDITIMGGTGTRLDHVLGNLQVLSLALSRGCRAELVDEHNRITLHDRPFVLRKDQQWGKYVSFFAWGGDVQQLNLRGFAYEVENFHLDHIGTRTISNQIRTEIGEISFSEGMLLCIESRD